MTSSNGRYVAVARMVRQLDALGYRGGGTTHFPSTSTVPASSLPRRLPCAAQADSLSRSSQDAWENAHRIAVESEKPASDRGSYLHPKELGQSEFTTASSIQRPVIEASQKSVAGSPK
jgi:hypothetical protein